VKIAALVFFISTAARAQGTGTRAPANLPAHWIGAGGGYSSAASPRATGWVSLAILVSQPSQIYSYSSYDLVPVKGHVPMVSARTGAATVLRRLGNLYVLGMATAGAAQTSTATTGAFSGGGIGVYRFRSGFTLELAGRVIKAGSTNAAVYEFGGGWSW